MKKYYINYTDRNGIETVDDADNLDDAKYLFAQYRMADPLGKYKISRKPTKCWEY